MASKKLYSLRQACDKLGITVRTLRQWVHDGKIKAFKYPDGRRWFITQETIDEFIARGEENGNKN